MESEFYNGQSFTRSASITLSSSQCSDEERLTSHDINVGNRKYSYPMDPFASAELLMIVLSATAIVILTSIAMYIVVSNLQL